MSYDEEQLAENRRKAAKTATTLFVVCALFLVGFVAMVWFKLR